MGWRGTDRSRRWTIRWRSWLRRWPGWPTMSGRSISRLLWRRLIGELSDVLGMEIDPANLSEVPAAGGARCSRSATELDQSDHDERRLQGQRASRRGRRREHRRAVSCRDSATNSWTLSIDLLGPKVHAGVHQLRGRLECPISGLFHELGDAIIAGDPFARPVPLHDVESGTDAKLLHGWASRIWIHPIAPPARTLLRPFHGIDERVRLRPSILG